MRLQLSHGESFAAGWQSEDYVIMVEASHRSSNLVHVLAKRGHTALGHNHRLFISNQITLVTW